VRTLAPQRRTRSTAPSTARSPQAVPLPGRVQPHSHRCRAGLPAEVPAASCGGHRGDVPSFADRLKDSEPSPLPVGTPWMSSSAWNGHTCRETAMITTFRARRTRVEGHCPEYQYRPYPPPVGGGRTFLSCRVVGGYLTFLVDWRSAGPGALPGASMWHADAVPTRCGIESCGVTYLLHHDGPGGRRWTSAIACSGVTLPRI
jgi:hypothetical protein